MPLTTVTIVVEPVSVPVGDTELEEVDSKSSAEVDGVGDIFEKVEVFGVVGMGVGEDDVDINGNDIGVVLVGVDGSSVDGSSVDGSSVVVWTGIVIVLVFVVKNVASRQNTHIRCCC